MEYNKPKRYVTYHSEKCKKYLAKDFRYECGYCKFKQKFNTYGNKIWETDHFKPTSKFENWDGVHRYDNLIYSCSTCNNSKGDKWSENLLNPCVDDIYNKHIVVDKKTFKIKPNTEQGKEFIETLKLNSTQNVKRRKLLDKLETLLSEEQKRELFSQTMEQDDNIKFFINTLKKYKIKSTYGLYEYDLDFKLEYNQKEIYCDVDFDENVSDHIIKEFPQEKLKDWKENFGQVCFIKVDLLNKNMYYCDVLKKASKSREKQKARVNIDKNNIVQNDIEQFIKTFF